MFVDPFPEEQISDYPAHGPIIRVLTKDKEKEIHSGSGFMKGFSSELSTSPALKV